MPECHAMRISIAVFDRKSGNSTGRFALARAATSEPGATAMTEIGVASHPTAYAAQ